jgi:hypothetical protein
MVVDDEGPQCSALKKKRCEAWLETDKTLRYVLRQLKNATDSQTFCRSG